MVNNNKPQQRNKIKKGKATSFVTREKRKLTQTRKPYKKQKK